MYHIIWMVFMGLCKKTHTHTQKDNTHTLPFAQTCTILKGECCNLGDLFLTNLGHCNITKPWVYQGCIPLVHQKRRIRLGAGTVFLEELDQACWTVLLTQYFGRKSNLYRKSRKRWNFNQHLIGILLYCTYNILFPNNHHGRVHQCYSLSTFFWARLTPKNSAKMQSTSQCFVETWPPHAQLATRLRVLSRVFTCFTLFHWWRWWFGSLTTPNKKQAAWNNYILMTTVPPKKETRTSYKTKPNLYQQRVNKQINTQTKLYHPWTPITSGSLTFPNVFSKKKKKQHTFQTFSEVPHQQKEKADRQPLPLPYLKRMVKRRLYLSHPLPKSESFHRYVE